MSRSASIGRIERTLAIIKPDAKPDTERILALVAQIGFYVVKRAEVAIVEDTAKKLSRHLEHTPDFEGHVNGLIGEAVVLVLSKVNAVQTWLDLIGPESPTQARREKPHSLRALYGTDDVHNAIYGSSSVASAAEDIALFFESPDPHTKEGVMDALVPTITEGMAELALSRPSDPYMWLASWIHNHRPPVTRLTEYKESVLDSNSVLKSDRFEGIGKVKESNIAEMEPNGLVQRSDGVSSEDIGYWNFRKSLGIAPVFGMGQSTKEGIEACLRYISRVAGYDKIICLNMREEPVIFIDGLPTAPREMGQLNENVAHLVGIDGYELTLMERRLKQDVIAHGEKISLYHQTADMENHEKEHEIVPEKIQTLEDVYQEMNDNRINCQYVRIPITDETAPDEAAFDSLVNVMKSTLTFHPAFVMNCQMGRGRTTTAMVCMSLFWRIKSRVPPRSLPPIDETNRNLPNGEFLTILKLLKMLPDGTVVKMYVDTCIDECGSFHNLRTSINEAKEAGEKAENSKGAEGRDATFWFNRALNYLQRYYYVLLFGAYLLEHTHNGLETSFKEYLRRNWQLKSPIAFASLE